MRKLLQINPVIRTNTSTGRIMKEIGEMASKHGWESYVAYSGGRDGKANNPVVIKAAGEHNTPIPVGTKLSVALHGLETRLFDRHGLGSRLATRRLIKRIKEINPDIIHIHNIHGYFLNYRILFDYLSKSGKPVVWTIHDCWLYTGHCYYYSAARCDKWKNGCGNCPQKKDFPTSMFLDRSTQNFKDKSKAFNSVPKDRFVLVPVSEWIGGELRQSYLKDNTIQVIHNGIDTSTFAPQSGDSVRAKYGLGAKAVILGLASIWMKEKGFEDFKKMSSLLAGDEVIVMVGKMTEEQKATLTEDIITIPRTDNVQELAELYSTAIAFVNPTWQDNYPTVNLEAISCGTPVITYRTGGSTEAISPETGFIVEQGDVDGLLRCVQKIKTKGKDYYSDNCRRRALSLFDKHDRYEEYLELYSSLIQKKDDKNI